MNTQDNMIMQFLAKLLQYPNTITFKIDDTWEWDKNNNEVLPSELLYACSLVEATLTEVEKVQYADYLYNKTGQQLLDYSGVYYPGETPEIDLGLISLLICATWQQRVLALAAVKRLDSITL